MAAGAPRISPVQARRWRAFLLTAGAFLLKVWYLVVDAETFEVLHDGLLCATAGDVVQLTASHTAGLVAYSEASSSSGALPLHFHCHFTAFP